VKVVLRQVEFSASVQSLFQRSPTECFVSVIFKGQQGGGLGASRTVASQKIYSLHSIKLYSVSFAWCRYIFNAVQHLKLPVF